FALPPDMCRSARQVHAGFGLEITGHDAGHNGRDSATAAGQRFAGTALEYAQPDVIACHDLHEADVNPFGEGVVGCKRGPDTLDRRIGDIGYPDHGMWVAQRNGGKLDRLAGNIRETIAQCRFETVQRNALRVEDRYPECG